MLGVGPYSLILFHETFLLFPFTVNQPTPDPLLFPLRIGIEHFDRHIDIKIFWSEKQISDDYIEIFDENEYFYSRFQPTQIIPAVSSEK
jgi:hypothetical protein